MQPLSSYMFSRMLVMPENKLATNTQVCDDYAKFAHEAISDHTRFEFESKRLPGWASYRSKNKNMTRYYFRWQMVGRKWQSKPIPSWAVMHFKSLHDQVRQKRKLYNAKELNLEQLIIWSTKTLKQINTYASQK